MSEPAALPQAVGISRREWTYFMLRRLHSLTGVLPIGVFLLEHFYSNYQAIGPGGAARFNDVVRGLQTNPVIVYLEIFGIGLPILYHAFYGLFIAKQARMNIRNYDYARNWTFLVQRLTGVILVFYIGYHVWMTRMQPIVNPELFAATNGLVTFEYMRDYLASVHFSVPTWAIYVIGITASVFHFANGLWGFLIHWGITVGPQAQRISAYACAGIGLVLLWMGLYSLAAFV